MPSVTRTGDVFVLDLGDGENRFTPDWMTVVSGVLEDVAHTEGPRALVTTATGKFWSNGLDLEWLNEQGEQQFADYVIAAHELFAKLLELPVPTVAAVQGHAFAAGGMLTLAHDFRVMRADRGFFCLPEVDLGIPFTGGMTALILGRLAPRTAHEAMTTGRRYGGTDALAAGIVDLAVAEDQVLPAAVKQASDLAGKAGPTLGLIKQRMYAPALARLRDTESDDLTRHSR
ncbi:enoyl-CoA hydratase/isomerase family protein [Kineosporia sp. J2-2]|uniref:Enoyl-CoA hydratase/isomerase family protein n=1 Tax=Kineosporia corallincola TaxID=2835133 RepID=A0ABS5TGJ7_9ACTN|nr:enoyl-CoA hydratase-related protein [Kineosporia corallincola]MBT0769316.1 enoyl-CoA hydratase/isomerase family protein [Kineosporia corallincola]